MEGKSYIVGTRNLALKIMERSLGWICDSFLISTGSVENLEKVALTVTFVPSSYLILSSGVYQLVLRIAVLRLLIGLGGDFFYRAIST